MMYVILGNSQIFCPRYLFLVWCAYLLSYLMLPQAAHALPVIFPFPAHSSHYVVSLLRQSGPKLHCTHAVLQMTCQGGSPQLFVSPFSNQSPKLSLITLEQIVPHQLRYTTNRSSSKALQLMKFFFKKQVEQV